MENDVVIDETDNEIENEPVGFMSIKQLKFDSGNIEPRFDKGSKADGFYVLFRSAVTSNWAVCCTLKPTVLPPVPPEGVKVPGETRTRDLP
ncbi:hypothetical protein Tco_0004005 [Tanacetum coccineum]